MIVMQNRDRLRQLVGDYYHGLITLDSYREQRAELLDNIGAVLDERSDTVTNRKQPPPEKERQTSPPVPTGSEVSKSPSGSKTGVVVGVVIAAIAVIGYVVVTQIPDFGAARDPQTEQGGVVQESGLERGDALLQEFVSRNDWSDDSLSNFLLAWGALDEEQRQQSIDGRRYRQFTATLHQRIREESALVGAQSSGRLANLADFAVTIGAPYRASRAPSADQFDDPKEAVASVEPPEDSPTLEPEEDAPIVAAEVSDAVEESTPAATPSPNEADESAETASLDADTGPAIVETDTPAIDDPCPAALASTRRPYCQDVLPDSGKGPSLVVLMTGDFEMGDSKNESESPVHSVNIAYNIAMSRHEVTADEYASYCAATSLLCVDQPWGGDHPVVSVSWADAVSYTEWLSAETGFTYRLPSEAEWEFAARAGTQSPYFFGEEITPAAALSSENGPVETPLPRSDRSINRNPFRLYHMSGNVREWTLDAWYPQYDGAPRDGSAQDDAKNALKVVRGGSYSDPGSKLRSAAREALDRNHRDAMTGFRVVREVLQPAAEQ